MTLWDGFSFVPFGLSSKHLYAMFSGYPTSCFPFCNIVSVAATLLLIVGESYLCSYIFIYLCVYVETIELNGNVKGS